MNRDLLSKIMIFAAGAGIGSVVTWKLVKTKYEQLAQEEIESVREVYANRVEEQGDTEGEPDPQPEPEPDPTDKEIYKDLVDAAGYVTETDKEEEGKPDMERPYVISPEEFGECDYAMLTLHYYTDGVVANQSGKILANVDELIGEESLTHFGDYEDDPDTVYVRNDALQIDYEILMDYRPYSEID